MDLRRRNGAVIRHDLLFRKACKLFCKAVTSLHFSVIFL
jgi:hypothetical protein